LKRVLHFFVFWALLLSPLLYWCISVFFLNVHKTNSSVEGESTTGCVYNLDLLMTDLWGLKHVEERGNTDTVYRRKRIVYQDGNKDKLKYHCLFFR
jgi:hypothetical protein